MSTKTPLTLSLSKCNGQSTPGTPRELPDFLKRGSVALQAPIRRSPVCPIGKGFPEMRPPLEGGCGDAMNLREEAVRGWLAMVGRDNGSMSVS